jgi:hypothetical protein
LSETIHTKIRGVTNSNEDGSSRQSLINKYVDEDGGLLLLERERDNLHDANAIAVHIWPDIDIEGETKIGYLSGDLAAKLAPILDSGGDIVCMATERTGGDEDKSFGVNLELTISTREELEEYERKKAATRAAEKITPPVPGLTKNRPSHVLTKPVIAAIGCGLSLMICMFGIFFGYFAGLFIVSLNTTETSSIAPKVELPKLTQDLKPQDVIDSFQAAGLEVGMTNSMGPNDYGLAPLADEGIHFLIPSLCADCGGRVLYYRDLEYLQKAKDYYDNFGKETAALFTWAFVHDHILLQINGDLPEARAREYEKALMDAE